MKTYLLIGLVVAALIIGGLAVYGGIKIFGKKEAERRAPIEIVNSFPIKIFEMNLLQENFMEIYEIGEDKGLGKWSALVLVNHVFKYGVGEDDYEIKRDDEKKKFVVQLKKLRVNSAEVDATHFVGKKTIFTKYAEKVEESKSRVEGRRRYALAFNRLETSLEIREMVLGSFETEVNQLLKNIHPEYTVEFSMNDVALVEPEKLGEGGTELRIPYQLGRSTPFDDGGRVIDVSGVERKPNLYNLVDSGANIDALSEFEVPVSLSVSLNEIAAEGSDVEDEGREIVDFIQSLQNEGVMPSKNEVFILLP